jgi:N-acetylneuraminic acid mutarotase
MKLGNVFKIALVSSVFALLCQGISWASLPVLFFDSFDDGNFDGWSATYPTTGDPATPPDVVPSPQGYSLRGVGSGYYPPDDPGLTVLLSHPVSLNNVGELAIEFRAKSGPQWPNQAQLWLVSGKNLYCVHDYGESNKRADWLISVNGQTQYEFNYSIGNLAYEWHDFAWARDGNGWWSLSIDGQIQVANFYQDNQLTSFDKVGLHIVRNQSEIEWVRISGLSGPSGPPDIQWTRIADLPGDQYVACAALIDGLVYMVGGQDLSGPPMYNKMRIYNPATNSWSDGPPMPTRRYCPGAGVIEWSGRKELYVVGGYSGYGGLSTVERYIPSQGIWESAEPLSERRGHFVMTAVVNNNLYAMGGFYNWTEFYSTNEMYDRQNNVWVLKALLPRPMQGGLPAVWNGKIYIFGGSNADGPLTNTLIYDPVIDTWSEGTAMPRPRLGTRAVTFGDYIYLIGGNWDSKIIDVYDPANDLWSTINDYPGSNSSSPVIAQSSNLVYVLGDYYGLPGVTECWVGQITTQPTEPPIAEAGDDIVADANEQVTLDGSGSSDPDGQIIKYTWKRLPDEVVIYSGPEPTCQTKALGRVEEVIELTVTDNSLATATDTIKVISRTTQDLKDQLAAMQSQIQQLQQQSQETRDLVDRICSYPPIKWWLRRAIRLGDLNQDGKVNMSDFALLSKDWLH